MTATPQDELLARFSKNIDLPAYLGQRGYEVVPETKNPAYLAMADKGSGQILLVAKQPEAGGWAYKSAVDPRDRGSIVDYLERHERLNRSAALERLIACLDPRRRDVAEAVGYRAYLQNKPELLRAAEARHDVALQERSEALKALARVGLQPATTPEWRVGSFHGSAAAAERLLGEPADLWASRYRPSDKKLIIAERPIDALSCAQSRREDDACYLAVGSELTPTRKTQLAHLLAELPAGVTVVLAFGRDQRGRELAAQLQGIAPDIKMSRAQPEFGARWNDQVQIESRHARSLEQRQGPGLQR
jgi:hypothetical protein